MNDALRRATSAILALVAHHKGSGPERLRPQIEALAAKMWEEGTLPYALNSKHWVVGFRAEGSFMTASCGYVVMGPKSPSRFRPTFCKVKYDRLSCFR